jgi:hypothetical protein
MPNNSYPFWLMGTFVVVMIFIIIIYYEQHKDVTILISNIQESEMNKDKKTLQIKYNDGKYAKAKTVDMPDTDAERRYIIDKLNEINIFNKKQYANKRSNQSSRHG